MPAITSHTCKLTVEQMKKLKAVLEDRGFEFREVPYAHFGAGKEKVQVVAYESGKCVVQGKGSADFVEFILEPEVTGEAKLGYDKELNPAMYEPHIGVDESGKGDFFGPLVTVGVYADADAIDALVELGVRDSKSFTSDKRICEVADEMEEIHGLKAEIISMSPDRYNDLWKKMGSVNEILGWCHAKVIENLLGRVECARAISDQFARTEWTIRKHLGPKGKAITLDQRHKAETDIVVAAASILARRGFVRGLEGIGRKLGVKALPGASAQVKELARQLVKSKGADAVAPFVKTHFKTWNEITGELF